MNAVLQTMVDEKIGPGERKKQFTASLCEALHRRYGLMVRSLFEALRISLASVGLRQGDTVGMSVLSPRIYQSACASLGLHVALGDIDPACGCLAADEAKKLVDAGAKAILLAEPMGMIPHGQDYSQLGVPLIEDISQSIGSSYELTDQAQKKVERAGDQGSLLICSFEEEDMISCAGGAGIFTSQKPYKDAWTDQLEGIRKYVEMPDMNAALGIIQYETFDEQLEKRNAMYRAFRDSLMKTHHTLFGIGAIDYQVNGYGFAVFLDSKIEEVMQFATKYQVPTQKTFAGCVGSGKMDDFAHFPHAIPYMMRTITFPIYPFIAKDDQSLLSRVISHLP